MEYEAWREYSVEWIARDDEFGGNQTSELDHFPFIEGETKVWHVEDCDITTSPFFVRLTFGIGMQ